MTQRNTGRSGLLPSASTQAVVGIAQADIAYRVARSQASRGVDQETATEHALRASVAILAYAFFVFPVMIFTFLAVWTWNPVIMVWKFGQIVLGMIIFARMVRWVGEPASNRLSYAIPTWVFVTLGGISVFSFSVLCLILFAAGD